MSPSTSSPSECSSREPVVLPTHETMVISGSIGIDSTDDPGQPAEALLREADLALHRAKEVGRDRSSTFGAGLHEGVLAQVTAERQVRRALGHDGLCLHHQPIARLADGHLSGAEALIRLYDAGSDRLIGPDGFMTGSRLVPALAAGLLALRRLGRDGQGRALRRPSADVWRRHA